MTVNRVQWALKNDWRIIFIIGLTCRLVFFFLIPTDWNSDSYHHWMISYYTLHIGLNEGRMWDLLGSDYYWGMIPHLVQSFLQWVFHSPSIGIYRVFNIITGGINSVLIYRVAKKFYSIENARWAGLTFALFPISVIFDSLALQDTLALTLALGSLSLIRERFFWSGILLGLACHSRIEYTLVSVLIIVVFIFMEQLETDSQPFIYGWLATWGIPSIHIYQQTGNPIYPLYYSLYSVFGGYTSTYKGLSFGYSMSRWVFSRAQIWGGTTGGALVILLLLTGVLLISKVIRSRWYRYQPLLYFTSCFMVMTPLVLPYLGENTGNFLIMLRLLVPSVAFGLPLLYHLVSRLEYRIRSTVKPNILRVLILGIVLSGYALTPSYSKMQETVSYEFSIVDRIGMLHEDGSIVCDIPSMVYRLTTKWGVEPEEMLSNLYSPKYYGDSEPESYLEWLKKEEVTVWMYYGERGDDAWRAFNQYPYLLENKFGEPRSGAYLVNQTVLYSFV